MIDHRIQAIGKPVDKFGLYTHHLQNVIADTSKQLYPATLQGKFNKLIESKVILRTAFPLDVLTEAKIFGLCTQKSDLNLIEIVSAAESTKCHYVKLRKKMENDSELVFTLPTLASVISEVKKDNDTESWLYQDQMLKHFNKDKGYTQSHAVETVNKIIACFDECFISVH